MLSSHSGYFLDKEELEETMKKARTVVPRTKVQIDKRVKDEELEILELCLSVPSVWRSLSIAPYHEQ